MNDRGRPEDPTPRPPPDDAAPHDATAAGPEAPDSTAGPEAPNPPTGRVPAGLGRWVLLLAVLAFALLAFALLLELPGRFLRPSETEIRAALYTAIQRETPETFLLTGSVDLVGTTTVANTRRLFPGILDLSLGTTSATVRMPGRVSYGIDLSGITPADIVVDPDGAVTVRVPPPAIRSVEPALAAMEVRTDVGWARVYARSGRTVEQEAIRLMEDALRAQGEAHLKDSNQPRRNSAAALENVLVPALEAAGIEDPKITVLFADTPRPGGD